MREILFRGKRENFRETRKNYCEWVYGVPVMCIEIPNDRSTHIITWCFEDEWDDCDTKAKESWRVFPETVGQYTGLNDNNGNKIFEGDIVRVNINGHNTICTVNWAKTVAHFQLWQVNTLKNTPTNLNLGNYATVVIGNIHDNTELLEENNV